MYINLMKKKYSYTLQSSPPAKCEKSHLISKNKERKMDKLNKY